MVKTLTIVLAVSGLGLSAFVVCNSPGTPPKGPPASPPAANPFEAGIAASGVVEAASRNIRVAPPEPAVVEAVFKSVGDRVGKGEPLFRVDTRLAAAERAQLRAAVGVAREKVVRLKSDPRPEDVAPLRAAVERSLADLSGEQDRYDRVKELSARGAASDSQLIEARLAVRQAEAAVSQSQAELDRILAGTWDRDVKVAESELAKVEADLGAAEARVERCTVRSPVDGTVLKRLIEPAEFAPAGAAAMIVGDVSKLHVRAQIDENDVAGLRAGAGAVALAPGTRRESRLSMIRIEPMAVPKSQLTSAAMEFVDARVVEAVFEITDASELFYPGQVVDVVIDAGALRP